MTVRRSIHALLHVLFHIVLFILKTNEALISYAAEPPPTCATLYYMLDIQLCLQPQFLPHTEHSLSTMETPVWCH